MKKILTIITVLATLSFAIAVGAVTKGRVIPTDTVIFHKDGQTIAKFTEQAPINDSVLMTCNKMCSVRMTGMSLLVADETTFAVKDKDGTINLYVKEGLVTFNVKNVTQRVSFYTPDGVYIKNEGFLAPSSADETIKGFMSVANSQAQIGMDQGGMILATGDGDKTVNSGYTYTVGLVEDLAVEAGKVNEVVTSNTAGSDIVPGLLGLGGAAAGMGAFAGAKANAGSSNMP